MIITLVYQHDQFKDQVVFILNILTGQIAFFYTNFPIVSFTDTLSCEVLNRLG